MLHIWTKGHKIQLLTSLIICQYIFYIPQCIYTHNYGWLLSKYLLLIIKEKGLQSKVKIQTMKPTAACLSDRRLRNSSSTLNLKIN